MKFRAAAFALAAIAATPAFAGDAASLRNAPVISSDGKVVGNVNRVVSSATGVSSVQLIIGNRMVTLAANTFAVENGTIKCTQTKRELERN